MRDRSDEPRAHFAPEGGSVGDTALHPERPSVKIAPEQALTVTAPQPVGPAHDGEVLPPKKSRKRVMLLSLLALAAAGGAYEGHRWYTVGRFLVSTDDAYIKADMATLAAKIPGYVASVAVVENQSVKAGDVLARIDNGDYRLAVDSARQKVETQAATVARIGTQALAQRAVISQAIAQQAGARADSTRSTAEYERNVKLVQSSYGTQQKLEQALADRDRSQASIGQADAAVEAARANLVVIEAQQLEAERTKAELQTAVDKAQRDLDFTEIRAPFDGVIGNKAVQPGQYVQPGTRVLSLVPLDSVYVEANFKETQIGPLKPGQQVDLAVDAYSDKPIVGTVESFAPASGAQFSLLPPENATGNFTKVVQRLPTRIKVPTDVARQGLLRPGMSVIATVHTKADAPTARDGETTAQR